MKHNRPTLLFLLMTLFAVSFLSPPVPSVSADEKETYGDIDFQDLEEQKRVPYKTLQRNVIEYFSKLESSIVTSNQEDTAALRTLKKNELDFLAALYLHCSLQKGACPVILDAVLESDVFNSATANESACPNMTGFWKAWVAADMERRLDHGLKVGNIGKATSFKKKERPAYIKCKKTISEVVEKAGTGSAVLGSRYSSAGKPLKNLKAFNRYLTLVEQKIPNIFFATNTR